MKIIIVVSLLMTSLLTIAQTETRISKYQLDSTVVATKKKVVDSIMTERVKIQKIDTIISKISKVISVRKTFDGSSKDENKPATFIWNRDFENGTDRNIIDLGIKVSEWDIFNNAKFLLYPKFELHRDNSAEEGKEKNTVGGGLTIDIMPWTSAIFAPYFSGSFDYKNDYIKELETLNYKCYISAIGQGTGAPHYSHRIRKYHVFEYYIFTGVEYYKTVSQSGLDCTAWANRIFIDWRPIPILYRYLQFTGDYTYRVVGSDDLYNKGNLQWLALAINVYVNNQQNIGVGIEYTVGEDPLTNFVDTEIIALGLKFKL